MTLYLPGIDPQEPEVLPACPPEQARRPRPRHRDDSLATLGSARATLGADLLSVTVPHTTPLLDLIRAGERLGYRTTGEGGRERAKP